MKKFKLTGIWMAVIMTAFMSADAFALQEIINDYEGSDITRTVVRDADQNGTYDEYEVTWVDGYIGTYGIGDLRRWPPGGSPRIVDADVDTKTFKEIYETANHQLTGYVIRTATEIDMIFVSKDNEASVNGDNCVATSVTVTPNPAADRVYFNITLSTKNHVNIQIFDAVGNVVKLVVDEAVDNDSIQYSVDITDLSAGVYYLRFMIGDEIISRQLNVVR